ncbi:MAG: chromate efflux transporter [Chloroflexi bacterium]|nr:chromate efflux transporter [Chloroflexota bacterium]
MSKERRLREVVSYFFVLGCVAFGGPAAHVALMHRELVERKQWLTEQQFVDLWAATNLIPGPNSTEMAIHISSLRGGWRGLIGGGIAFILPAAAMVTALAWGYTTFGHLPQASWILYGVKPVVIAIVIHALIGLLGTAWRSIPLGALGLAAGALALFGINELLVLFGCGVLAAIVVSTQRRLPSIRGRFGQIAVPFAALGAASPFAKPLLAFPSLVLAPVAAPFGLVQLFLTFLKIGAVLYGSGYVLLAFLHGDFVEGLGWLSEEQLLDAVAVGQLTPGPLFTTASFIGYVVGLEYLGSIQGALLAGGLATVGIFLPSFLFVAAVNPWIPRLRESLFFSSVLDGVVSAAMGLMAAVAVFLGQAALIDIPTVAAAGLALVLLWRTKINSIWLIVGGASFGIVVQLALPYVVP